MERIHYGKFHCVILRYFALSVLPASFICLFAFSRSLISLYPLLPNTSNNQNLVSVVRHSPSSVQ
jgi:hypothetical protein